MKKVRINVGKVGIVKQNGDFKGVLQAGVYWLKFRKNVYAFDMGKLYSSTLDLDIMLQNEQFSSMVELLKVNDHEVAMMYSNGNFEKILGPGRYFYFKGLVDFHFERIDRDQTEIPESINLSLLQRNELLPYVRSFKVESYEEGLLFVNGKYQKTLNKGVYYFVQNAIPIELLKADKRLLQMELSGQEILTKDKAAIRINFFAQYKIEDVKIALMDSKDCVKQLYILIQLALREAAGAMTLDELLDGKEAINSYVLEQCSAKAYKLGIRLIDSGIRDIILPGDVKEIMNQVLVAQKRAQANVITRREETASTRNLLNTAKLMENNQMLFKLKEMEYVEKIADNINSISLSGGGQIVNQLKDLFGSSK